jgi:hypothetical protein
MEDNLIPPWSAETVDQLNAFQTGGRIHPFTCREAHPGERPVLVATPEGFVCPDPECGYTQPWAFAFMNDPRWRHTP